MTVYYAIDPKFKTWDFAYTKYMAKVLIGRGMIVKELPDRLIGKSWTTVNNAMAKIIQDVKTTKS